MSRLWRPRARTEALLDHARSEVAVSEEEGESLIAEHSWASRIVHVGRRVLAFAGTVIAMLAIYVSVRVVLLGAGLNCELANDPTSRG